MPTHRSAHGPQILSDPPSSEHGKPEVTAHANDSHSKVTTRNPDKPVHIYTSQPFPTDWSNRSTPQKLEWLNNEPLPGNPTVSLGQIYHRAQTLSNVLYVLFSVLYKIRTIVARDQKEAALYANFLSALNEGVGRFHWELHLDNEALLENGKYPDAGLKPDFVRLASSTDGLVLPGLPPKDANGNRPGLADARIDVDSLATNWVNAMLSILCTLLQGKYPALTRVRPALGVSYAQLLESAVLAGEKFLEQYNVGSNASPIVGVYKL